MEKSNVRLDTNSGNGKPEQQRELDSAMEMGQSLAGSKNKGASYIETEGVVLLDTFRGGIFQLIDSIKSLVELDMRNALVPHGIGGHARNLFSSAAIRLEQLRQRVAELEYQLNTEIGSYASQQIAGLTAERDSAYTIADHYRDERDALKKEVAHWKNNHETEVRRARILKERTDMPIERVQAYEKWGKDIAERDALLEANRIACEDLLERHDRIAELQKQRNELLVAAEAIEIDAEECLDFDECTAMLVPIDTYHKLMEAIASVKEK